MRFFLIILILFVGLLSYFGHKSKDLPDRIYRDLITSNRDFSFFKKFETENLINGGVFNYGDDYFDYLDLKNIWRLIPFTHFEVPIPVKNPLYLLVPWIQDRGLSRWPLMGFDLVNNSLNKRFIFRVLEDKKFIFHLAANERPSLFNFPLFKSYLEDYSMIQIWKDLFYKDLLPIPETLKEKVYNLYLLFLRKQNFPTGVISFHGHETSKNYNPIGIVRLKSEDQNFNREQIWILEGNDIRGYEILYLWTNSESKQVRQRFIENVKTHETSTRVSKQIYTEVKTLSFSKRITNEGMKLMYAAWSHQPLDKEFLKEMIQFLERGKNNFYFLDPLYQYAKNQFGSSLSIEDNLEKVKKKIKDEILESEFNSGQSSISVDDFLSTQDKIDVELEKVKRDKINVDKAEKSVIID